MESKSRSDNNEVECVGLLTGDPDHDRPVIKFNDLINDELIRIKRRMLFREQQILQFIIDYLIEKKEEGDDIKNNTDIGSANVINGGQIHGALSQIKNNIILFLIRWIELFPTNGKSPLIIKYLNAEIFGPLAFFLIGGFIFGLTYSVCNKVVQYKELESTIMSIFISHMTMYLFVLLVNGPQLYNTYSYADGFNIITRFTIKTRVLDGPFNKSNMINSISSSVAARGTTTNKMMVGVAYSIGALLFLKFIKVGGYDHFTAIGYLLIICTGSFESRTWNNTNDKSFDYDGLNNLSIEAIDLEHNNQEMSVINNLLHYLGVIGFIFVSNITHLLQSNKLIVIISSIISLTTGSLFIMFNFGCLHSDCSPLNNKKQSRKMNIFVGLISVFIELISLTSSIIAGVER